MSIHEDWKQPEPPKQGMSTTAKVLLIVGSIAGLCLLLCCGGGVAVFLMYRDRIENFAQEMQAAVENASSSDPDEIQRRTRRIAKMEIPPGYQPKQALDMMVMRWVIYAKEEHQDSFLMLMEFDHTMMSGTNAAQQREAMLENMRQQQNQSGRSNSGIQIEERRKRTFTVLGETVEFDFNKGKTDDGRPVREVVGSFKTQRGIVLLMLRSDEESYDEDAVVKMIESIGEPAADAEDDEVPPDQAEKTSAAGRRDGAPAEEDGATKSEPANDK